jgi:predicted nucleic acid-binding protein
LLVAALVRNDPDHRACAEVLRREADGLVLPTLVLAEAGYLVARAAGPAGEATLLQAAGEFRLETVLSADLERMRELVDRYADLPLGTVDASIVAAAERQGLSAIASLDRKHFSVVRPKHAAAFELMLATEIASLTVCSAG